MMETEKVAHVWKTGLRVDELLAAILLLDSIGIIKNEVHTRKQNPRIREMLSWTSMLNQPICNLNELVRLILAKLFMIIYTKDKIRHPGWSDKC